MSKKLNQTSIIQSFSKDLVGFYYLVILKDNPHGVE